jgi:hypothetical protein
LALLQVLVDAVQGHNHPAVLPASCAWYLT